MPSVFLSHTRVDKPFVEKLADHLKKLGVNVWFDKWEIRVGDSITWKIDDGIRENEFLAIVLSPDALRSEWVKTELSAAWIRQMNTRRVGVLPILLRDCEIPLLLADRRYADFRTDFDGGISQLAGALGIRESQLMSEENWRRFAIKRAPGWQKFRQAEFERLVTVLVDRAVEYNWSTWVGGRANPFSITLSGFVGQGRSASVSLKLSGKTLAYMATLQPEYNPNRLRASDFHLYVGNTTNECEEFVWRHMEDFRRAHGDPTGKAHHYVERFTSRLDAASLAHQMLSELSWYKGEKRLG
jgi:hypothetical protein